MAARNIWTSDRRLYLDAAGKVVEADDPTRATLLVNAGGAIPIERAEALGLVNAPAAEPQPAPEGEKAKAKAPANKAKSAPEEDK